MTPASTSIRILTEFGVTGLIGLLAGLNLGLASTPMRGGGSHRAFERIVPLLGGPGERNVMEYALAVAGRVLAY